MSRIKRQNGISLIELLLALVLATTVVASLSIAFPLTAKNVSSNRQRAVALNLATTELQSLKSQPYPSVDTTDSDPAVGAFNTTCDCTQADFSALPSTTTVISGSIFRVSSCVDYVTRGSANNWTSQCGPNDSGSKSISVRVSWQSGSKPLFVTQEALLTR